MYIKADTITGELRITKWNASPYILLIAYLHYFPHTSLQIISY